MTDKEGKVRFPVTFPDNITTWNTVVYAMNSKLKTGTARLSIKSYKPLMAELKNPLFLVAGDSSYFAGNIRNYTYGDREIKGQMSFAVEHDTIMKEDIRFTTSHQDKMLVVSPPVTTTYSSANDPDMLPLTDSLSASYLFSRDDGYRDGERRTIPVLRQGTEVAEGELGFLSNGDKKEIKAAQDEEINIIIASKQLNIYMDAVSYLRGYKYDCNEQLASKLVGLLNYKVYTEYTGEKFRYDRNIRNIIRRLTDNRNDDMLWSWWGHSSNTSYWMSAHVIRALTLAKRAGYDINTDLTKIEQEYVEMKNYRRPELHDLYIISALSDAGTKQDYRGIIDFMGEMIRREEHTADSVARKYNYEKGYSFLKEKMMLLELRQQHNIGYSADSLTKYLKKDAIGGVYLDDGKWSPWYNNNMIVTLTAYRIVRNDPNLHHLIEPMQMYLLGTKCFGWNTYQASSAVMTILPDLLADSASKESPASVLLSGKENKQLIKFPYETKLMPGEYLTIKKESGVPLIYSAYKTKYVTEENTGDAFEVKTELPNGTVLKAGVPVTMKVIVTVKQESAEHVMIEVPIPAGCSYESKRQSYGWRYNYEIYSVI